MKNAAKNLPFVMALGVAMLIPAAGWSGTGTCVGHLYVTVTGDPGAGDGSEGNPYRTISKAVERAREIRAVCADSITIHVGPGDYLGSSAGTLTPETFPIVIDVSDLELRGSTVLDTDQRGLPAGTFVSATTLTDSLSADVVVTALIFVKPGAAGPTTHVTISGFVINGQNNASDIAFDRIQGLTVRGNILTLGNTAGIFTRASSGLIEANYFAQDYLCAGLTGGNEASPANLTVEGNRFVGGGTASGEDPVLIVNGAGDIVPVGAPDPRSASTEVFDTITATISGNDIGSGTNAGIQLMAVGAAPSARSTHITATIDNNTLDKNAFGVVIEAGFSYRPDPRVYGSSMTATFENNVISNSGTSPALVTFFDRGNGTTGVAFKDPVAFKYLQNSTYNISHSGELDGLWIDHPAQDPVDCRTLCNQLEINGVEMPPPIRSAGLGPAFLQSFVPMAPFPSACPAPTACP